MINKYRNYWGCAVTFRLILPCVMATGAFFRPSITSYVHLAMGLYMPFFSVPTAETLKGATGVFLKMFILISILTTSLMFTFYMVLFFPKTKDFQLEPCSALEKAIRTLGIVAFDSLPTNDVVAWALPEPLVLSISIMVTFMFKKCTNLDGAPDYDDDEVRLKDISRRKLLKIMLGVGELIVCFLLCLTSILKASAIGAVYYVYFVGILTYWACNQPLGRIFARFLVLIALLVFLNISWIFAYQLQYLQENAEMQSESLFGRLFNLVDLKTYKDCKDPRIFHTHRQSTATYLLPFCLFVLYHVCVLVARELLDAEDGVSGLVRAFFTRVRHSDVQERWRRVYKQLQVEIDEEKQAATGSSVTADKIKAIAGALFQFIASMCHVIANFTMMLWAIVYVDVRGLVFLIWANLIWLLPYQKEILNFMSPLVMIFINFMLLSSYLYSIDVTEDELPSQFGILDFREIIAKDWQDRWSLLVIQSLFAVIIFISMKQLWIEFALNKEEKRFSTFFLPLKSKTAFGIQSYSIMIRIKQELLDICWMWWIWLVVIVMIRMGFWDTSSILKIIFVAFGLIFIMGFQLCPFPIFKRSLFVFWWIVIIYALFNLLVIYLYQINHIREVFYVIVPPKSFRNIGFKVWTVHKERFANLANPLFFQIVANIQVTYFQREFNRITTPVPRSAEDLIEDKMSVSYLSTRTSLYSTKWSTTKHIAHKSREILFGFLEIYLHRILLILAWFMCLHDLCAIFVPAVVLLTFACNFGRKFTRIVVYFISTVVCLLIVLRLFYMRLVHDGHHDFDHVVTYTRNEQKFNTTLNTADWLGFHQSRHGPDYADGVQMAWCFIFIGCVTMHRIVSIRRANRIVEGLEPPVALNLMFPEVNGENCHGNTGNMLKYLFDNVFFKFGCEITFIYSCFATSARMDALTIGVMVWLLCMFSLKRVWIRRFWLTALLAMSVAIPLQYILTLGWWPANYENSMTGYLISTDLLLRMQQFCYMSNMIHPPKKNKLHWDYMLLQLVTSQWLVFLQENKLRKNNPQVVDGPNDDVSYKLDDPDVKNPVPDFVTYTKSHLDSYKRVFFPVWFYGSIFMVLFAGVTRTSLYAFGYLAASCIFLWEGSAIFLRHPKQILRRWNVLIAYNVLVLTGQCVSQIFGCILNHGDIFKFSCYAYRIFEMSCIDNFGMWQGVQNFSTRGQCEDEEDPKLLWDCFCFFGLIVQQRIFKSYHFFHMVNCTKADIILENRGAILIEEDRHRQREEILNESNVIQANIKIKLQRYHANMHKIEALRDGDNSLFDEVYTATDVPLLPKKQVVEEEDSDFDDSDPMSISMFLQVLNKTDVEGVLSERKARNKKKRKKLLQVRSVSPKPSTSAQPSSVPKKVPKKHWYSGIRKVFLFLLAIFEGIIVSLTKRLNKVTKKFRLILRDMAEDSKIIKEKLNYIRGWRDSDRIWHPKVTYEDVKNEKKKGKLKKEFPPPQTVYVKLFKAIWYLMMSHTEWLCYCLIVTNQAIGNTLLSLPQTLMVFCWGCMSVPLPSKTYWIVNIGFCLVTIFLQTFFDTNMIPWKGDDEGYDLKFVFFAPKMIGVWHENKISNLLLLFALFFHRGILQMLGLWKPYIYREYNIVEDGSYKLGDKDLVPVDTIAKNERAKVLVLKTEGLGLGAYFPKSVLHGISKYGEGVRLYIQQLITPSSSQIPVDMYTPMFFCELFNFFLMIFCFYNFLERDNYTGIIKIMQDNQVPVFFLASFSVLALFMVIDRFIYIRRNRFGKLMYHYMQVLGYHMLFFIVHPLLAGWYICDSPVIQTFYIVKCLYFLFSGYQIRNGYKVFISYHCLWHHHNLFTRYAYKIYRVTPYFIEIRLLLDWIATESSLGMPAWFKTESITNMLHEHRCQQEREDARFKAAGEPVKNWQKMFIGTILCSAILLALVFPLLVFSVRGQVGATTHPENLKLSVYFNLPDPIFEVWADPDSQVRLTKATYREFSSRFNSIQSASEEVFDKFKAEDVVVTKTIRYSFSPWDISPGSELELFEFLKSDVPFKITFEVSYLHLGGERKNTEQKYRQTISIPPLPDERRKTLAGMIIDKDESVLTLPLVFPKFLKISGDGTAHALKLMETGGSLSTRSSGNEEFDVQDATMHRNMLLSLKRANESGAYWFEISEDCDPADLNYVNYLENLIFNDCKYVTLYVFNEKVFSGNIISFLTKGGVVGLYLMYIMMIVNIFRVFRPDINDFVYRDAPYSEDLMRKVKELYIARDYQNFHLEREIFEELLCIFRSSELLIKVTRFQDGAHYNPTFIIPE